MREFEINAGGRSPFLYTRQNIFTYTVRRHRDRGHIIKCFA